MFSIQASCGLLFKMLESLNIIGFSPLRLEVLHMVFLKWLTKNQRNKKQLTMLIYMNITFYSERHFNLDMNQHKMNYFMTRLACPSIYIYNIIHIYNNINTNKCLESIVS